MPIQRTRRYRFAESPTKQVENFIDFSEGMNTRDPDFTVKVREARNVRIGRSAGFKTRPGSLQKGSQIGTASKILGLHSYVKKDNTSELLATYNTDIYRFTETSTPSTVATTTNAQGVGYSKDRKVFFTAAADVNSAPYLVVLYQNGSGIQLEYSSSPYTSWATSPVVVDTSTQIGFAAYADSSDNIHVAYMDTANSVKYVKLTYSAGPAWSVGTKTLVKGTGAADQANNPTVYVTSTGTVHVGYRYVNTATNGVYATYSTDGGATWAPHAALTSTTAGTNYATTLIAINGNPYYVHQYKEAGDWQFAYTFVNGTSYVAGSVISTSVTATLNGYSVATTGSSIHLYFSTSTSTKGVNATSFGMLPGAQRRQFSVVTDGVNDNDIQYQNVISGSTDPTATRVTNDANNNLYPTAPQSVPAQSSYVPVVFQEGTASPYNIKVNSLTQWVALSASLTAAKQMESALFPKSAAGGTDQIYFVNGTDTAKKWDGTTLTSAAATGYPVSRFVVSYDNRLWFWNLSGIENRGAYTNLGADNFASPGTFPAGNTLDLPAYVTWAVVYRDRQQLVFTREGVYAIQNFDYSGAAAGQETIRRIPDSYGTLSGRTVKQVGSWVYYQSPDGQVRRTNGQWVEEPAASGDVQPSLAALNIAQLTLASAGVYNDYYMLSVAASGSAQPDQWWVLDATKAPNGGWQYDTGKYASCFVTHPNPDGVPQLFYGESRSTNGTVYQGETGTSDNGSAIDMQVITGTNFYGSTFYNKDLRDILILAEATGAYDLTVGYALSTTLTSFSTALIPLDSTAELWGTGVWGTGVWGGSTNVEDRIPVNRIGRGFKYSFSNNAANQPVSLQGAATTFEVAKDSP